MSLALRYYGDQILRRKADAIEKVDDRHRKLAEEMIETMYDEEGIGLAAPQIGESICLLVIDGGVIDEDDAAPRAYINPEIDEFSSTKELYEEGCLSIPGIRCDVERPVAIRLHYTNLAGEQVEEEVDGIHARVLQHEIDHLEGILFVDRIGAARRTLLRKKLKKIEGGSGR